MSGIWKGARGNGMILFGTVLERVVGGESVANVTFPDGAPLLKVPHFHAVVAVVVPHMQGIGYYLSIRGRCRGLSGITLRVRLMILSGFGGGCGWQYSSGPIRAVSAHSSFSSCLSKDKGHQWASCWSPPQRGGFQGSQF
jgi:hypothetical protein